MSLMSGKVYSNTGAPNNADGVDGDIYMQLDGFKTTYRKESGAWVAIGSSLGAIPEIISGSGAPSGLLGADEQYYRDSDTQDIYYRSGGTWSSIGNLQGASFLPLLLIQGVGKDLGTSPNLINSGSLNSYIAAGEYYFTNNVANRPFDYGLMKVWRESPVYVYQIVQGSGGQGLATRYSSDGGSTWTAWNYTANRNGDSSQTFKVDTAAEDDEAVPLNQVRGLVATQVSITTLAATVTAGTFADFTLQPKETVRIYLVGGGGEGGKQSGGGYEVVATDGEDSLLSNLSETIHYVTARGGTRGQGGWYEYQGGARGADGKAALNRDYYVYSRLLSTFRDVAPSEVPATVGVGGTGAARIPNHNSGGHGGEGAFVDVLFTNVSTTPLELRLRAASAVGADGADGHTKGEGGICLLFRSS